MFMIAWFQTIVLNIYIIINNNDKHLMKDEIPVAMHTGGGGGGREREEPLGFMTSVWNEGGNVPGQKQD